MKKTSKIIVSQSSSTIKSKIENEVEKPRTKRWTECDDFSLTTKCNIERYKRLLMYHCYRVAAKSRKSAKIVARYLCNVYCDRSFVTESMVDAYFRYFASRAFDFDQLHREKFVLPLAKEEENDDEHDYDGARRSITTISDKSGVVDHEKMTQIENKRDKVCNLQNIFEPYDFEPFDSSNIDYDAYFDDDDDQDDRRKQKANKAREIDRLIAEKVAENVAKQQKKIEKEWKTSVNFDSIFDEDHRYIRNYHSNMKTYKRKRFSHQNRVSEQMGKQTGYKEDHTYQIDPKYQSSIDLPAITNATDTTTTIIEKIDEYSYGENDDEPTNNNLSKSEVEKKEEDKLRKICGMPISLQEVDSICSVFDDPEEEEEEDDETKRNEKVILNGEHRLRKKDLKRRLIFLRCYQAKLTVMQTVKMLNAKFDKPFCAPDCVRRWFRKFRANDFSLLDKPKISSRHNSWSGAKHDDEVLRYLSENTDRGPVTIPALCRHFAVNSKTIAQALERLRYRYVSGAWIRLAADDPMLNWISDRELREFRLRNPDASLRSMSERFKLSIMTIAARLRALGFEIPRWRKYGKGIKLRKHRADDTEAEDSPDDKREIFRKRIRTTHSIEIGNEITKRAETITSNMSSKNNIERKTQIAAISNITKVMPSSRMISPDQPQQTQQPQQQPQQPQQLTTNIFDQSTSNVLYRRSQQFTATKSSSIPGDLNFHHNHHYKQHSQQHSQQAQHSQQQSQQQQVILQAPLLQRQQQQQQSTDQSATTTTTGNNYTSYCLVATAAISNSPSIQQQSRQPEQFNFRNDQYHPQVSAPQIYQQQQQQQQLNSYNLY